MSYYKGARIEVGNEKKTPQNTNESKSEFCKNVKYLFRFHAFYFGNK